MPWVKVKPVFDERIIGLCGTPYHAHRYGCHNFCKRASCPPTMEPLSICLDDFWLIYIKWPIGKHVKKMLAAHPEWTIYQAQNVLYWQGTARKVAAQECAKFLRIHPDYYVLAFSGPKEHLDSWGIDVGATIAQAGIKLQWGPNWGLREHTYVLRYAGISIENASPQRLARLRRTYPLIYGKREGACKDCEYRPCLKSMINNPHLYIKKRFGLFVIERFVKGRGWLLKCDCGKRKLALVTKLFCKQLSCTCQRMKKAPTWLWGPLKGP